MARKTIDTIVIEDSASIARHAADVFNYLTNPSNVPLWSAVVTEVEPIEESLKVGSRRRANLNVLGVNITTEGEVIALDPINLKAGLRTRVPLGASIDSDFHIDDLGDHCVVHFVETISIPEGALPEGLELKSVSLAATAALHNTMTSIQNVLNSHEETNLARFSAASAYNIPPPQQLHP